MMITLIILGENDLSLGDTFPDQSDDDPSDHHQSINSNILHFGEK